MALIPPHLFQDAKRKAALGCATTRALLETIRLQTLTLNSRDVALTIPKGQAQVTLYGSYEDVRTAKSLLGKDYA